MIANDAVGSAITDHVGRDVDFVGIDKAADHVAIAIQFGDGVELILVQEALSQGAVDLFAYSAVTPIDKIVNGEVAR